MSKRHESITGVAIGAVAQATGLSPHVIRAWERRYSLIRPRRAANGQRRYSERDIARIRGLQRLVRDGHSLAELARVGDDALENLLAAPPAPSTGPADVPHAALREQFLSHLSEYRLLHAQSLLARSAVTIAEREWLLTVAVPLLRALGERWESGQLNVALEHAASNMIRSLLGASILTRAVRSNDIAVATTLPGDRHELGALLAGCLASQCGWSVCFLGADVPIVDLVQIVRRVGAGVLLISAVRPGNVIPSLEELRRKLPRSTKILVGGSASPATNEVPAGVRVLRSLDDLETELSA